jgi:phosphatidate cytidylyltransferase
MPNISPNKTLEGCIGNTVFCMLWAVWLKYMQEYHMWSFLPPMCYTSYMIFGAIISIFGIFGDALESFVKRVGHVKDSGVFFPGHGGILDRFDTFFLCGLPAFFFLYYLVIDAPAARVLLI